jgi:hypothetical protein
MKKILVLVMVLGVLGGVLVGCGDKAAADNNAAPTMPAKDAASS